VTLRKLIALIAVMGKLNGYGGIPPGGEVLVPKFRSKAVESLRKSRAWTFTIRRPFLRLKHLVRLLTITIKRAMKTIHKLKQIIQEEIQKVLTEQDPGRVKCATNCKARCNKHVDYEIKEKWNLACSKDRNKCFKDCYDPCFDKCDEARAKKSAGEAAQKEKESKQRQQKYEKEAAKRKKKGRGSAAGKAKPKTVGRRDDHCLSNRFCRKTFTKTYKCKKCYCDMTSPELVRVKDKSGKTRIIKHGICASKTTRSMEFEED